jgi:hypothetical protein
MGHPGMCPLTGRAPAPTNSEGISEPHPTTDRAVKRDRIRFRTGEPTAGRHCGAVKARPKPSP